MRLAGRASLLQGLQAMSINPLRTILSMVGVVIGVASVIATLALADGLEAYVRDEIATQTDVQSVTVSSKTQDIRDGFSFPSRGYPIFTESDAEELERQLGGAYDVTMEASGDAVVSSPMAAPHVATVTATLANYVTFERKDVLAGRYFIESEASRNAPVVVLSYLLARELAPSGDPTSMIGRFVRVRGRPVATVGVMPEYLGERGYQVFVPLRAAAAAFGAQSPVTPTVVVRAPRIEQVDATKDEIVDWLASRYRNWDQRTTVTTQLARLAQVRSGMLVMKLVFGALAGISLLVGGVGIMNVLLASVAERTREIGVRKALGARQRDILFQFLAESVAIASVGSSVGTIFGFVGAFALAANVRHAVPGASLYAAFTAGTLLVAIVSAVTIGLTFGTFPALRASRLSPIDAIRHD
jgi:putative ABC transport system permease protein